VCSTLTNDGTSHFLTTEIRMSIKEFAWVCFGGACGSGLRFFVTSWTLARYGSAFPFGTLAVNIVGSLILACLFQISRSATWLGPTVQLALGTGVMGGLTTYSTFNLELVRYLQEGQMRLAVAYGTTTLLGCLLAGALGLSLGRLITAS
jgi:fluoride exporter